MFNPYNYKLPSLNSNKLLTLIFIIKALLNYFRKFRISINFAAVISETTHSSKLFSKQSTNSTQLILLERTAIHWHFSFTQ